MSFTPQWTREAESQYAESRQEAEKAQRNRKKSGKKKKSKAEGLFEQVHKAIRLLLENPRHPGLRTHEYSGIANPYDPEGKVWEAYAQNRTPGAYRVFWCYGPEAGEITLIAITPHP